MLRWRCFAGCVAAAVAAFLLRVDASDILPPGFRPLPTGTHALLGGRVVVKPGETLEGGTIFVRDGLIEQVGKGVLPPPDARIWDLKGTTIYAGFIDPYLVTSTNNPVHTSESEPVRQESLTSGARFFGVADDRLDRGSPGPSSALARITPEVHAVRDYSPSAKMLEPLRELGFTAGVIAPGKGIIRGTSGFVLLSEENPNRVVLKPDVFQHIAFDTRSSQEGSYPNSLMGVIASIRQSLLDANYYSLDQADYAKHPQGRKRPEYNPSLDALQPALDGKMKVVFEPGSALMVDRAARLATEQKLDFCIVSCGQEWRRPDLAKGTGATFIVPLGFPTLPKLPSDSDWEQVRLDQLRAWDWAPENPAVLRKEGLEIALTTYGLEDKKKFRSNLRLALDRGLTESDALAALTIVPAKLCGVEKQLGTIEPGKLANLTVVEGTGYFNPENRIRAVWIEGRNYPTPPEEPKPGQAIETKVLTPPSPEAGSPTEQKGKPAKTPPIAAQTPPTGESPKKPNATAKKETERDIQKKRVAHSPLEGRGAITNPPSLLIRNATLWTCSEKGVLTNANLLVSHGKIENAGNFKAELAADTMVIDGTDLQITPGIIDCHSHTAILGLVNESTVPSSAMVRIHDVVNSETEHLREQLAGGVTAVNLLHGSANPIGGQNCVIKLRDGVGPEDLVFAAAPPGIKFALGENVKQSNWGERFTTRFPQTRMGVRTFIANRFTAAQTYLADIKKAHESGRLPPRRDLELEAIGEIINGTRLIHCHSYRQDEILMLIRLMESFGVRIGTFQHVLEGYKIADEIAQHGAGGSTFADWWAYKFEVYDAIPYNASLMRERGVVVSINSDSSDLARRLYTEAAKSVRFGNTPEAEALKFVTLNPAKQLHIDKYVGSLEPGKDADFAIWSRAPLDSTTVCLQTWIDGKKYFDRELESERVRRLQKERNDLIAKAKKLVKSGSSEGGGGGDGASSFFSVSLEHEFDYVSRGCAEGEAQ